MLTITEIGGFAGAGLSGAAYVPQISHLIRARCSAGISRLAFGVWLVASVLITARAIAIHSSVFIALGGIEIVATTFIVVYAARYRDTPCPVHRPCPPTANTGATGNEPGGRRPAGRPNGMAAVRARRHGAHVSAASSLVPALSANAETADATRRLPGEDITAPRKKGLSRLATPRAYGGHEAGARGYGHRR